MNGRANALAKCISFAGVLCLDSLFLLSVLPHLLVPDAASLTSLSAGRIGLVDQDVVDTSNLHRQVRTESGFVTPTIHVRLIYLGVMPTELCSNWDRYQQFVALTRQAKRHCQGVV